MRKFLTIIMMIFSFIVTNASDEKVEWRGLSLRDKTIGNVDYELRADYALHFMVEIHGCKYYSSHYADRECLVGARGRDEVMGESSSPVQCIDLLFFPQKSGWSGVEETYKHLKSAITGKYGSPLKVVETFKYPFSKYDSDWEKDQALEMQDVEYYSVWQGIEETSCILLIEKNYCRLMFIDIRQSRIADEAYSKKKYKDM